jgi:hypothetical protein
MISAIDIIRVNLNIPYQPQHIGNFQIRFTLLVKIHCVVSAS